MKLKEFIERHGEPQGMPGGDRARHTCIICKKKRFEEHMEHTGEVNYSNYKAWLEWTCKESCPI